MCHSELGPLLDVQPLSLYQWVLHDSSGSSISLALWPSLVSDPVLIIFRTVGKRPERCHQDGWARIGELAAKASHGNFHANDWLCFKWVDSSHTCVEFTNITSCCLVEHSTVYEVKAFFFFLFALKVWDRELVQKFFLPRLWKREDEERRTHRLRRWVHQTWENLPLFSFGDLFWNLGFKIAGAIAVRFLDYGQEDEISFQWVRKSSLCQFINRDSPYQKVPVFLTLL